MIYLSLIGFIVALLGAGLLLSSWAYRRVRAARARRALTTGVSLVAPVAPFLLGSGAIAVGTLLSLLGVGGDVAAYKMGHGITPLSVFGVGKQKTLAGTISITDNWAQLNLDPGQTWNGQPIQGYVVLLKDLLVWSPTDLQLMANARRYFRTADGAHCVLSGQIESGGDQQYFRITTDVCGGNQ